MEIQLTWNYNYAPANPNVQASKQMVSIIQNVLDFISALYSVHSAAPKKKQLWRALAPICMDDEF